MKFKVSRREIVEAYEMTHAKPNHNSFILEGEAVDFSQCNDCFDGCHCMNCKCCAVGPYSDSVPEPLKKVEPITGVMDPYSSKINQIIEVLNTLLAKQTK